MKKDATILITGAHGMVGRNVVEELTHAGYTRLLPPSSTELDLCDAGAVETFVQKHKPASILHLAARVGGIQANIQHPVEFLRENLLMSLHVFDAARRHGVTKLITLGSSCMYPRACPQPMKEEYLLTGVPEPTNESYALAKIVVTRLAAAYHRQFGMNCFTLVAPNMYGRYERFDPASSHVISALLMKFHRAKVAGEREVAVWGTGKARREFLFAGDMAKALLHFLEKVDANDIEGTYLNVGTGSDVSIAELADMIRNVVGYEGKLVWDTTKPDGMPQKLMECSRLRKFGWRHSVELHEGLRALYDYFLSLPQP
jgi:GDP-L-fucose synthase